MFVIKFYWKNKMYFLLKKNPSINKGSIIEDCFEIGGMDKMSISNYKYIGSDAWIDARGGLNINSSTIIDSSVRIPTFNHRYEKAVFLPYHDFNIYKKVVISKNVWIGSDVLILPGSIINEGLIVSAGSLVRGELKPLGTHAGNPIKLIREREVEHYSKLNNERKIYLKYKFVNKVKHEFK